MTMTTGAPDDGTRSRLLVEKQIRRDTPGFTQGLEMDKGAILEGTGNFVGETRINRIDPATGKVVIDVSNRPTPDPSGAGTSAAEELQARIPGANVVKAFNTAFATRQAEPVVEGVAADGFVAGDDDEAKQKVLDLVESIGFRPVDAGSLAGARTLEGMAWLNISRAMQGGGTWQDAWVILGPDSRS